MVHRPAAVMSAGSPGKAAITSRQAPAMDSQMSSSGWTACPGTEMSYGWSRLLAAARARPLVSKIVTLVLCEPLSMASRYGFTTAASRLQREDRARVHHALGVERLLQGRQQPVGAAVLVGHPRGAVLADPMVVHHRPARAQGFFDDDRVERLVVDLDLLARAAPDVVVVDEVQVGPGLVAVRGMGAEHRQVAGPRELAADPAHDGGEQVRGPRPVDGDLGGVAEAGVGEHVGLLGVDLVLAPVEVLEPRPYPLFVDPLVGTGGEELLDRDGGGVGEALRAFRDQHDDVAALLEAGEVLAGVLGLVDPAHRRPVPGGDQFAER